MDSKINYAINRFCPDCRGDQGEMGCEDVVVAIFLEEEMAVAAKEFILDFEEDALDGAPTAYEIIKIKEVSIVEVKL